MKPKHQRLMLGIVAAVAIAGAGILAASALRDQAAYFYTPSEARAAHITPGTAARLGGMVSEGSLQHDNDGVTIRFRLTDGKAEVPVMYRGIVPDLFKEKAGAVADGTFNAQGIFVADKILAKHDEKYMPPQMGKMPADAGKATVANTASGKAD